MPQDRTIGRNIDGPKIDGRELRGTKLFQIALSGAVVALALCGNTSFARAGDDDVQSQESFTDKFLHTLGIRDPNETQYEINYSERSPLVVPPNRNLPPPVSSSGPPAPNWPKDPDVQKRKSDKDDDKPQVRPYDSVIESERALRPDELNARTVSPPGAGEQSTPSELGEKKSSIFNFSWTKKEEYGTFTGEPPRVSLTDPPPGYQTPSPDQPYGIVPEHTVVKPSTLEQRLEPTH
jgi:hypothetical protein